MDLRALFKNSGRQLSRVYLDYAAATPVSPEVYKAMQPYFSTHFANPSAIHSEGRKAREVIETSREALARILRIRAHDIVFTANGTESNNLAIFGLADALLSKETPYSDMEILTTKIEHASIHESLEALGARGVKVTYLPVDENGRIERGELEQRLNANVILVTIAYVNSEIGVVEDIKSITRIVRKYNDAHGTKIKVHTDASQAPLWLPCQMDMLGVDLMTLDAGKCYGPKGVGVLAFRHGIALKAQHHGGGQEQGLRSGTESTALIVGCVESIKIAQKEWESVAERIQSVRDYLIDELLKKIDGAVLNGPREGRVANNINISIPGIDSEFAVVTLDVNGVAASTKSACGSAGGGGSRVVEVISGDTTRAASTIRFSLGRESTVSDAARAVEVLSEHVKKMRSLEKTSAEALT